MGDDVFATLGPKGSNHDFVLRRYLRHLDLAAGVKLCTDFDEALNACETGKANRILICAAHGSCPHVVGTAQYSLGLTISDVFISASQPLAILTHVDRPISIALHPSTRPYTSLTSFERVIEVGSTVEAAEGLRARKWDAALTAARFASGDIRTLEDIAAPLDAWLAIGGPVRTSPIGM